MLVVQAIWKAEIGGIEVQAQPREKFSQILSQPIVWHSDVCLSSQAKKEAEIGRIIVSGQQGKKAQRNSSQQEKLCASQTSYCR
jgi:hypothetical protein